MITINFINKNKLTKYNGFVVIIFFNHQPIYNEVNIDGNGEYLYYNSYEVGEKGLIREKELFNYIGNNIYKRHNVYFFNDLSYLNSGDRYVNYSIVNYDKLENLANIYKYVNLEDGLLFKETMFFTHKYNIPEYNHILTQIDKGSIGENLGKFKKNTKTIRERIPYVCAVISKS